MYYKDTSEKAAKYLRLLVPLMVERNIPANPQNYAIWYEYVTGRNQALNKEIDQLLKESTSFSDEVTRDLFNRYLFSQNTQVAESLKNNINAILLDLIDCITENETEQKLFVDFLEARSIELDENITIQELRLIIEELTSESNSIRTNNNKLKDKLTKSQQQLQDIKTEFEHKKQDSDLDSLTGIKNLTAFERSLLSLSINAIQANKPLSILMLDIDHFNTFNQRHGNAIGDAALKVLVKIVQMNIKGADVLARYGEDKFVILLPDTPLKGAVVIGEKIRSMVQSQKMKKKSNGDPIKNITVSIGTTVLLSGEKPQTFVERSLKALSYAKSFGRNRIYQLDYIKEH